MAHSAPAPTCPWLRACRPGRPAILALLLAAAPALWAGTPDLLDLPLDDLLQVEVTTASKFAQPSREAPSAVAVITAADIRAQGYRTLAEALQSLPGVYAVRDHAYTFVGARGFLIPGDYNTRFLLLVDGIRINDNIYEQALFGDEFLVDLDLVERIEYIPGPGSSIYGANAMFGVINVVTRSAASLAGARLALRAGSDGERHGRFSWGGSDEAGNSLVVAGSAAHWQSRNRSYPDAARLGLSADGVAHGSDGTSLDSLFWRANIQGWEFEGLWQNRETRPSSALYGSLFDDRRLRLEDRGFYAALSKETALAPGLSLFGRVQVGEMGYAAEYPLAAAPAGSYLNVDRSLGRWWNGEMRLNLETIAGHRLMAGLEWQEDITARQRNFDQPRQPDSAGILADRRQRRWGFYLQDEWRLTDAWLLNLGLRHDRFSSAGNSISPRLAAIWQPLPGTTLKFLAGRAFRPANAYERDYGNGVNYVANPDLQPEVIRNAELVWEQRLGAATRVTSSLFHYRLDRLIVQTVDADGALIYRNRDSISARGLELAGEHRYAGGIRLRGSLALQRVEDDRNRRLDNSPGHVAKILVEAPLPGGRWTLGWETQLVGPRQWDWNGRRQTVGTQVVSNLTLSAGGLAPGLDVGLSLRNVFDRSLADPASAETGVPRVPQEGRTLVLRVGYAF